MEKNYYEILEVNKKASQETIEKVYKLLVKKYHPDLQQENQKNKFEEKIKKINEAYDILSNTEKRKEYDLFLKENEISIDNYNKLYNENIILKNKLNNLNNELINLKNNFNTIKNNNIIYSQNFNSQKINNNYYNKINNNYYNKINNNISNNKRNNSINYFKNYFCYILKIIFKNFLAVFLTILFIIIIGSILWNIPFTKNYMIIFFNENIIFKHIVDLFF